MRTCVLITCYNEGDLLIKAHESVSSQTKLPDEIIIVNDCSTDERTNTNCKNLAQKPGTKVIYHEENKGLSGARNTGIENACADIIIPLDADDELPIQTVYEIQNQFQESKDIDFLFGDYIRRDIRTKEFHERRVDLTLLADAHGYLDKNRLAKNWILLGTSPFKKSLWKRLNGYSMSFSNNLQDKDFWMRANVLGAKGKYIQKVLYIWNRHAAGMNSNLSHKDHVELQSVNYSFFSAYKSPELLDPSDVLYLLIQYKSPKYLWDRFIVNQFSSIKVSTMLKYIINRFL